MLQVPVDKIIPLTEMRDKFSKIVADLEAGTPLYILTKNGKPSVAVLSVGQLQKLIKEEVKAAPAPHMIERTIAVQTPGTPYSQTPGANGNGSGAGPSAQEKSVDDMPIG